MRRPDGFQTSMPGFADDSDQNGPTQTVEAGGEGLPGTARPRSLEALSRRRSQPTANAGGGRPDTSDCTPRCRTATSTGSESQGLPAKPQPTEPPDTDPYVRWCGRGLTEGPHFRQPLSRSTRFGQFRVAAKDCPGPQSIAALRLLNLPTSLHHSGAFRRPAGTPPARVSLRGPAAYRSVPPSGRRGARTSRRSAPSASSGDRTAPGSRLRTWV